MFQQNSKTLGDFLVDNAQRTPTSVMLAETQRTVTYEAALRRVESAAISLREYSVRPGMRVGLLSQRQIDTVLAMHAIWSAGAVVVLLDATWPDAVIAERCRSSAVDFLIHIGEISSPRQLGLPAIPFSALRASSMILDHFSTCAPEDPAYIIFTSGSSRRSKAVSVSHANVISYANGLSERLCLSRSTPPVFGHTTTFAADLGHTSIFVPLVCGGTCAVVSPDAARDATSFWQEVTTLHIDWLKTTPSHFRAIFEAKPPRSPRLTGLVLGGEPLQRNLATAILKSKLCDVLVNHYGPTETTIGIACFPMHSLDDIPETCETIPIGRALGDNFLQLDYNGKDSSAEGELVVCGPGVAMGYLDPSEAANGFLHDWRVDAPGPAYRTGDLCRQPLPGVFEFVGRCDRKVKVAGYSVDLNEVERAILTLPDVEDALVIPRVVDGSTHLVAGVLPAAAGLGRVTAASVSTDLALRLPNYAIPVPLAIVSEIPTTANGKRDATALLTIVMSTLQQTPQILAPSQLENRILTVFREILGLDFLQPDADIRLYGADSITLMRVAARLGTDGLDISLTDLMAQPSARGIAERLNTVRLRPLEPVLKERVLSPAQKAFFEHLPSEPNLWNQAVLLRCPSRIDLGKIFEARNRLMTRHKLLQQSFSFDGQPRHVSGSAGATGFGVTHLPANDRLAEQLIVDTASRLQHTLSLVRGDVFHLQVFCGVGELPDHLLLVAHHLVVDVMSWHVILDELAHFYISSKVEQPNTSFAPARDFWSFTASSAELVADEGLSPDGSHPLPTDESSHSEGPRSRILAFSRIDTEKIFGNAPSGRLVEARLLGALVVALRTVYGPRRVEIDVERHGRPLDELNSFSSTVGWFTRLMRVAIDNGETDWEHALEQGRLVAAAVKDADVSLNYVGNLTHALPAASGWEFSPLVFGPMRCAHGDVSRMLKVTGRIIDHRLILDLVVDAARIGPELHQRLVEAFSAELSTGSGAVGRNWATSVSTSGNIFLATEPAEETPSVKATEPILLTGATGFLGSHILRALLADGAKVLALVRGTSNEDARRRLRDHYQWTFPETPLDEADSVTVIACDIAREVPNATQIEKALGSRPAVVIHAAADTRLFAPSEQLYTTNVQGTKNMMELVEKMGRPLFVYLSTLAVAGHWRGETVRTFSEMDYEISDEFLTPYEQSKAIAENLVRKWEGAPVQIIRTGHVAADSETGRFQKNIEANRIFQLLRSYVMLGIVPDSSRENLCFSFVDVVARGILALALRPEPIAGIFHVESPYQVSATRICQALYDAGWPVHLVSAEEFGRRLRDKASGRHADSALVATNVWAHMPERRFRFDSSRTVELLGRLGVAFPVPSDLWLQRFLEHAVSVGFMPVHENQQMLPS